MLKKIRVCICLVILSSVGFTQVNVWADEEGRNQEFIEELQAKIKLLEAQIKRIEKEKEDNMKKYNKCMEDRITDANEIKKLNLQINEEMGKTQKLKEEMTKKQEELQKEIDTLNETIKKKDESIKNIQTQLLEKVKILKEKETGIEELNKKVNQLELQIQQLQSESKQNKDTIANLQQELKDTKEALEKKTQENKELIANLDKEKQQTQQLTTTLKEKEDMVTNLSEKLSTTTRTLAEKETELTSYKAKETEIEKIRLEIEKEKTNLQNLTKDMAQQIEDNKKLYEEYTSKIRDLTLPDRSSKLFVEEGEKRQNYTSQLYGLDLNEINKVTISELNYYLTNYPELEKTDEFQYLIGLLYLEDKENYLASAAFLKLITLYPESKFVPKAKAEIKKLEKNIDKNFYKKIEKLPSATSKIRRERFFIYLQDLHALENKNLYQYCLEQQEEFLKLYKDSREAVDVYGLMAETYLRLKEDYKAIATYLKIPLLYPLYPEVSRLADVYYAIGDIFVKHREYSQAIVFYEKAITLFPQYKKAPGYLLTSAQFYKDNLKQEQNVISTYNRIVSNYPESQEAVTGLFELGQFYEKHKRYQEAIKTYERLVKDYPKNSLAPQTLSRVGECYEKVEDYPNAIAVYLKMADEYPNYEEIPQRLFNAGELSEKKLNDVTRAMEIYNKIIDKYPADKFAESSARKIKQLSK